jgi:hypothetical protein
MQILHLLFPAALVAAHARIKYPPPLSNGANPVDYRYNAPLKNDGSDFPCKNLHKTSNGPITIFKAGGKGKFEFVSPLLLSNLTNPT